MDREEYALPNKDDDDGDDDDDHDDNDDDETKVIQFDSKTKEESNNCWIINKKLFGRWTILTAQLLLPGVWHIDWIIHLDFYLLLLYIRFLCSKIQYPTCTLQYLRNAHFLLYFLSFQCWFKHKVNFTQLSAW